MTDDPERNPDAVSLESLGALAPQATVELVSDEEVERRDATRISQVVRRATSGRFSMNRLKRGSKNRTDKVIILQLALSGYDSHCIADVLGQSHEWVQKLLDEAYRECAPVEAVDALRKIELLKLDQREQEAWKDYEESGQDEVTLRETLDKDGNVVVLKTTKPQVRNPAYQKVLGEIASRRAQLMGLDKPHKVQMAEKRQLKIVERVVVTREQVAEAKVAGLLK